MSHERRLEADLRATLADAYGEDRARDLTRALLEVDEVNRYLIGLRDGATRALFYRTDSRSIADEPVATNSQAGDERRRQSTEHVPSIVNRTHLREWIANREWTWLHPRYRWIVAEGASTGDGDER